MIDAKLNISDHACLGGGGDYTQKQVPFAYMSQFYGHREVLPVSYVNKWRRRKDSNPTGYLTRLHSSGAIKNFAQVLFKAQLFAILVVS